MGAKPKAMEEIRSVIRLCKDGFSNYAINEHTGISLPTIRKYLNRLKEVDVSGFFAQSDQRFSLQIDHPELRCFLRGIKRLFSSFKIKFSSIGFCKFFISS